MKWYRFLEICSLGNYKKRVTLETNGLFQFKHTSPVRFQDLDAGGHDLETSRHYLGAAGYYFGHYAGYI